MTVRGPALNYSVLEHTICLFSLSRRRYVSHDHSVARRFASRRNSAQDVVLSQPPHVELQSCKPWSRTAITSGYPRWCCTAHKTVTYCLMSWSPQSATNRRPRTVSCPGDAVCSPTAPYNTSSEDSRPSYEDDLTSWGSGADLYTSRGTTLTSTNQLNSLAVHQQDHPIVRKVPSWIIQES